MTREESVKKSYIDSIIAAYHEAVREGIKANSIIINENMVKVTGFPMMDPLGGARIFPDMICGLKVYLTKDELPNEYAFAVLEGPRNRLEQFEAIGMEPDELRKAAELYRAVKEIV